MTTNFYSVIKKDEESRMIISFTSKERAESHAKLLTLSQNGFYIVVPSEVTLFMPVAANQD